MITTGWGSSQDRSSELSSSPAAKTRNGLKCYYELALDGEDSRSILCNDAKVFKKAARDKIEYDEKIKLQLREGSPPPSGNAPTLGGKR